MSTAINEFLTNIRLRLSNVSAEQPCVIVMGNDAAGIVYI